MKIKVKKPNILLITADQFRWDTLGFLNKQNVKTPNIDKLAENSARHHNCFSVSPLCMSARCSILTGLYTHQHGMMDNKGDLSPLLPTLPQALKRHGYNTSMIGKIHFYETIPEKLDLTLCYNELNDLGFDYSWVTGGKTMAEFSTDEWTKHLKSKGLLKYYRDDLDKRKGNDEYAFLPMCLDEEDGVDYLTKETAIKYINNYSKENPFFMWLSFCNPHPIFDAPQKYFNMYNNVQINAAAGFKTNEQQDRMRQSYLGLVTMLDKYIGEVISSLKNKGIYDDTLIVFTADHGEMLCDNGLFGKCYPQEGSAKVPLLACLPGVIESGDYNQMIENTDICATFLEAAGCNNIIDELKESPSKSLFNMWRTGKAVRAYAFSENGYQFHNPWKMIVNKKYKYIYYIFEDEHKLYNRIKDPYDMDDISVANPEILHDMQMQLMRTLSITPPPSPGFWIGEKVSGIKSPQWHHGFGRKNISLLNH